MLRNRLAASASLVLILAACAGGPPPEPPPPPQANPVGTWDLLVDMGGQSLDVVMVITGSHEEGFSGSLDSPMGSASMADIAVDGMTMTFSVPDVGATASVTFEGDSFSGSLGGGMGDALIEGVRREG